VRLVCADAQASIVRAQNHRRIPSLAVGTIGHGLVLARGGLRKHAIKRVDRLLSNPGIDTKWLFAR
jgi:hypothetical protein